MRTLLIDNYDSYTYNLYQSLAEVYGISPVVIRNDAPAWSQLNLSGFDAAVISPGPGHPGVHRDFGHSRTVLDLASLPVLGVCLGHQGIGFVAGARVAAAPQPRHGHLTRVSHVDDGLFAGLPQGFTAVRYHSLCVQEPLPADLEAIAWSEDQVIMGLRHRRLPHWGVQFHPESVCTEHGARLLRNFRELALAGRPSVAKITGGGDAAGPVAAKARPTTPPLRAHVLRIDHAVDTERAFTCLFRTSDRAFWLDSSRVEPGLSRYSFLGSADGPTSEVLTFRTGQKSVTVESPGSAPRAEQGDIFDALGRRLGSGAGPFADLRDLPFSGGYVGYFGYELKADLGSPSTHRAQTPDAVWLRADRYVAVDHLEGRTYVVALAGSADDAQARSWVSETAGRLGQLGPAPHEGGGVGASPARPDVAHWLVRSRDRYLADIAECQRLLRAGESYEICLTNKITAEISPDPLALYRTLRRVNPAPFSAYLRIGEAAVASSSPERFLSIGRDRWVEAKPIKGTVRRGKEPAEDVRLAEEMRLDEKTRAENLMICDLLRNDMGIVCEIGTVHVPNLMHVESYETVHQLVSTVRGLLREELEPPDCIRACFPGGSMTGAPKKRTMEIIDGLEGEARGVYSGAIGYLGLSGGCDLNIVIRTVVMDGEETTIRVGGAIVMQSDAEDEYEEILLKARAPMQAIDPRVDPTTVFESAPRTSD